MNERIKELAVQANLITHKVPNGLAHLHTEEDLEKFSELIIMECFRVVDDYGVARAREPEKYLGESLKMSINITNAAWKIREHFGVEE